MNAVTRKLTDQSGAALALVAVSMIALLSAVALAVDVGMLLAARAEAQTLADAAALAGAGMLRKTGDAEQAEEAAIDWAGENTVRGEHVSVRPEDVDVIVDEWTVRVRVHRTEARGNPVPTFFARIFGVEHVDVSTVAAAWAAPATSVSGSNPSCPLLPLALLDKFEETNGDPGWQPGEPITGYDATDHGKLIKLKMHFKSGSEGPPVEYDLDYCASNQSSWRCWWRHEGDSPSASALGRRILGSDCSGPTLDIGDDIFSAPGNKQSQVIHAFQDLIELDSNKEWCETCAGDQRGCVVETGSSTCFSGESLRMRTVPIVDPPTVVGNGSNVHGGISGFAGVFVEQVSATYGEAGGPGGHLNVYVRLIGAGGTGSSGQPGGSQASLFRNLQLIE